MCTNSTNYEFFGIDEQKNLDVVDGTLGLAPDFTNNGTNFMSAILDAGLISSRIMSFYISALVNQSSCMFGGFDEIYINTNGSVSQGYGIHYYKTLTPDSWTIYLYHAKYRSSVFSTVNNTIISTG
jgi:hypothetical protein